MRVTFNEAVGAVLVIMAALVVSYAALFGVKTGSAEAMTMLAGVVGAGVNYFLRGKVQSPGS